MPCEIQSIPRKHRGAIINYRDNIKEDFDVSLYFPKNELFGEFQNMHVSGPSAGIRQMKLERIISRILEEAEEQYQAGKERRDQRRRKTRQQLNSFVEKPQQEKPTPKKSTNKFAGLEIDPEPIINKPKPKPVEEFPTIQTKPSKQSSPPIKWGPSLKKTTVFLKGTMMDGTKCYSDGSKVLRNGTTILPQDQQQTTPHKEEVIDNTSYQNDYYVPCWGDEDDDTEW